MFSRTFAILLAVVGLLASALDAGAQPRAGGGWGLGGRFGFQRPVMMRGFSPRYGRFGYPPPFPRGYPQPFARGYPQPYPAPPRYPAPPPRGAPFAGDWSVQQNQVRQAVREGRNIPLGQAIEAVRHRVPGRELDAGLEAGPNGRPVYRLRWAGQNGRRQDFLVDAGTGALLGSPGGP